MKDLIEKYKGEVYYIRGLDCWNSQTYHKKAVEHRIATTCDVFEREMDMTGVKNILVTNNYWVQIAKFNGRKNYNPEKIIKTGDIEAVPADSASKSTSLKIHYDLKEQGKAAANWVFMLFVNNSTVKKGAYNFGSYDQEIGAEQLQPGFNQVRFVVQDEATHSKLADVSKFYFEKANGAVALVDWPIESHQQGWGSMHKNESIDGNRFNVNGQHFDNGLGIHAASTTVFDIDKKYTTLKFSTGLDDESLCGNGVAVEVLGDGKSLAKTDFFQNGTLQDVVANVTGVKKLTIKTIPKEGIDCTHVDIINPVVVP